MKLEELKKLISQGESESVEFKSTTTQRKPAAKTICGMLNNDSKGYLFFGVSDKGDVRGQEVTSKTLEEISSEFRLISPPVFPKITKVPVDSRLSIIVVDVQGSKTGVYTYDGRPFVRYGATTQIMPQEIYVQRLMEKVHAVHRWEMIPAPEWVKIDHLDEEEIHLTLKNAVALGRMAPIKDSDPESILRGLGLIEGGKLLNAAIALYGKDQDLFPSFPQLSIRLARFRGIDRLADFSDNRDYWGHAFSLLRRGENFLLDHMPIAGRVVPGKMIREDYPKYHPRAFREALANAICHRDYTIPGGAVAVAMYNEHLEVINPGGFHFEISPEKLVVPHESKPWNPLIASVFYRAGVIEKWGSGTINILDWCKENQNPPPKWEERTGSVVVTFLPSQAIENGKRHQSGHQSGHQSEEFSLQEQIVKTLSAGAFSSSEIASKLGHKSRSSGFRKTLKQMVEDRIIEYTIPEKKGSRLQKYKIRDDSCVESKYKE